MIYVEKIGNWMVMVIMVIQVIINVYTRAWIVIKNKILCFWLLEIITTVKSWFPPLQIKNICFLHFKWLCTLFSYVYSSDLPGHFLFWWTCTIRCKCGWDDVNVAKMGNWFNLVYYVCITDLAYAISLLKENNQVSIPLVVFGHMHKELAHGKGFRKMIVVGDDNVIYLNGAIVPRVKSLSDEDKRSLKVESPLSSLEAKGTARAFTLVELSDGRVTRVAESWVSVIEDRTTLKEEHILFESN